MQKNTTTKIKALILSFLVCISFNTFSQLSSVTGNLYDSASSTKVVNAVVMLLHAKDSSLALFTRTDSLGFYTIKNVEKGDYVLYFTYPGKPTYSKKITVNNNNNIALATIAFKKNLDEIVVKNTLNGIKIKGDTTEYTADSFKVAVNANVADLLKKLPGMQIDAKGVIKAQGEKVEKILIDGDEFFGDDPTMVSKNLNAAIVDKVQVFDKKSDEAIFTGVDDGVKTKTINLTLKANAKKGYFGKIGAGAGYPNFYNNSAMINKFKGKQKLSGYATMGNDGSAGLDWDDREKYSGESWMDNMEMGEGGMMFTSEEGYEGNAQGGLPQSWSVGTNYGNKWDNDRKKLSASYQFNKNNNNAISNSFNSNINNDSTFNSNSFNQNFTTNTNHKLSSSWETNVDSLSTLKFNVSGSNANKKSLSQSTSNSNLNNIKKANDNIRKYNTDNTTNDVNAKISFNKKFKKIGRTLIISGRINYNEALGDNFLFNDITLYNNGSFFNRDTVDQEKQANNITKRIEAKIAYTEPLNKKWNANISYALQNSNITNDVKSLDKDINGKYTVLNNTFSNSFEFNSLNNNLAAGLTYNKKKLNLGFGTGINLTNFKQTAVLTNTVTLRNFVNFFPRANVTYKFKAQRSLSIRYNGSTTQPTINQLQPLVQNNNPLAITIGNPNLKQTFNHTFSLNFNDNKTLAGRSIWSNFYGGFAQNQVSASTSQDGVGRTVTKFINVNGNYNGGAYVYYYKNIKAVTKGDLNFNSNFRYNLNRNLNVFNGINNITINHAPTISTGLSYDVDDKYEISIETGVTYNYTKTTQKTNLSNNFFTNNFDINLSIDLTKKLKFATNANYEIRQKTAQFNNAFNVLNWNALLKYQMLKAKNLVAILKIDDILNQRRGYSRFATSNNIFEQNYQTIARITMLSLVWNFKKNPGQ